MYVTGSQLWSCHFLFLLLAPSYPEPNIEKEINHHIRPLQSSNNNGHSNLFLMFPCFTCRLPIIFQTSTLVFIFHQIQLKMAQSMNLGLYWTSIYFLKPCCAIWVLMHGPKSRYLIHYIPLLTIWKQSIFIDYEIIRFFYS